MKNKVLKLVTDELSREMKEQNCEGDTREDNGNRNEWKNYNNWNNYSNWKNYNNWSN